MNSARARFAAIAAGTDERIDLADAALVIAQEEYPELDVLAYTDRLDDLAATGRFVLAEASARARIARLNHYLFVERGFAGNQQHYYDPRNSFLNEVLDRRTGIPLTLSLVYTEVAQRLDLPVYGVCFPGHFLVRHLGDPELIIDPFFGTIITERECAARLRAIYGRRARLQHAQLTPASPREILVRLLSNLKQIYVNSDDFLRALACVDRILLLTPDAPRELRDRGILYQRLECFGPAVRDFQRYLQLAPDDDAAPAIRATLLDVQRQAAAVQ